MKVSWRTEAIPIILIIGMFILAIVAWPQAPDRIPIHWGLSGEPDNYASKFVGLFMAPLITLGIYIFMFILPKIDPRRRNYELFWSKYLIIRTILVLVFACIQTVTFLWAIDNEVDMNIAIPMIVGFLMIFLGNYLGKLRPTWFVGIRTPWTLSSEESWNKTHRIGGWMFVFFGLALVIAAIIQEKWGFYTVAIAGAAALVHLIVYSYLVWRKDPKANSIQNGVLRRRDH